MAWALTHKTDVCFGSRIEIRVLNTPAGLLINLLVTKGIGLAGETTESLGTPAVCLLVPNSTFRILYDRGITFIFTGAHISLAVAFKGPNVILGLYKCNYTLTVKRELSTATG